MHLDPSSIKFVPDIINHMQDQLSMSLYLYRLLYSETGDKKYIENLLYLTPQVNKLLEARKSDKLVVFGCGIYGDHFLKLYDMPIIYFSDNNEALWGNKFNNYKIIEPSKIEKDATVIICNKYSHNSIKQQLQEYGINNIVDFGMEREKAEDRQYFDLDEMPHTDHETFVDFGAFDGKSSINFIRWTNNNYKKIYAFEPDPNNYIKCKDMLKTYRNCHIINKGGWSHTTILKFSSNGTIGSHVDFSTGNVEVPVTSLDEVTDEPVTFIKMDIEGSELEALKGCISHIKKDKPKFAISIYHKPEDIIDIPRFLLDQSNDYKFYIRHYGVFEDETVLYAF